MTEVDRSNLTPMMQRYLEVKDQHPEAILFFRMGDFYELFYEDAKVAARVLGLTLTSRDKQSANPVPMAGFPYHALNGYLQKMIRAGHRVAICEQVEDPKTAKGMVKREVTQVVTPGTLTDDALLDPRTTNYLVAVLPERNSCGLAWLEVSSGQFCVADLPEAQILDELARLAPAEVLIPEGKRQLPLVQALNAGSWSVSERPVWCFRTEDCHRLLLDQFQTSTLAGFGIETVTAGVTAAGALLEYVRDTQRCELGHLVRLEPYQAGTHLLIDEATRKSLELTRTLRGNEREGSLLSAIDETVTPMGSRLLSEWLSAPLTDRKTIEARLESVQELAADQLLVQDVQQILKEAYDLQRLTARVATGRATPRDLVGLSRTLALLPRLKARLTGRRSARLTELESSVNLQHEIRGLIESAIVEEPPLQISEGGVIRSGYHAGLDECRDLARGGKEWIARYQAEEARRTGIPNLKVGYNRVFGYYLECNAAHADKVPSDYVRKQTLKNYERFVTPQLKEHEDKVLRAESQGNALELELFNTLRQRVAQHVATLRTTAESLAEIDVLGGLAVLATRQNYCRPTLTSEPILQIHDGRHPVLDRLKPTGEFIPNDVILDGESGRLQLITGPNMAGKSTYIRQAALITVLAQMGSFVPARSAVVGIADRIFARIGASDELGKGQSTFMVEMTETARILHSATERSLVILDEIGRGTSTYDGISLAWAITEYLHDIANSRTLFATHYHELTQLTQQLKHASNWNVAVREKNDDVIFLHKIVRGAADKSYGIHVARLAGLPRTVLDRARVILQTLETGNSDEQGRTTVPARKTQRHREYQLRLFESGPHPVLDRLRDMDTAGLSPEEALAELQRMRATVLAEG